MKTSTHKLSHLFSGVLLVTSLLSVATSVSAQAIRAEDGSVTVDKGVYRFNTGELTNTNEIPLPAELPETTTQGKSVKLDRTKLAPNTINVSIDSEQVRNEISSLTNGLEATDITGEVTATASHKSGSHSFAAGVGISSQSSKEVTAVVSGDVVTKIDGNQSLPSTATVTAQFNEGERATVRFFNYQTNNGEEKQSGVYFDKAGGLIVEDQTRGGDTDYDDGAFDTIIGGRVKANLFSETSEELTVTRKQDFDLTTQPFSNQLGFVDSEGNPTDTSRFEVDSEGNIRYTYQAKPLFNNNRPTLLRGTVGGNPFANDNEEAITATVGATQFLTRTHRMVEKTEYNGVLSISPPTELDGNVDAIYLNTTGVVVNFNDGTKKFFVQTITDNTRKVIRSQRSIDLVDGDVSSVIPAIIAEQPGTKALRVGDELTLDIDDLGYFTTTGLRLISLDAMPGNFNNIDNFNYWVEDTLASGNASVYGFDGKRIVAKVVDGVLIPGTVDYNDVRTSLLMSLPQITTTERVANRTGLYLGGNLTAGAGNRKSEKSTTRNTETTTGTGLFDIDQNGMLVIANDGIQLNTDNSSEVVSSDSSSSFDFTSVRGEVLVGGVWNYGGEAWTEDADTMRLEAYKGIGNGTDDGVRAEIRNNFLGKPVTFLRANQTFGRDADMTFSGGVSLGF